MSFEYEDITEATPDSAFEVANIPGYGFLRKSIKRFVH